MNRLYLNIALGLALSIMPISQSSAEVIPDKPPFALTIEQILAWHPDSAIADPNNRSTVSLAARIPADTRGEKRDLNVKVLLAPDGINGSANYIGEQKQFNLYTFTHWPNIDMLNWFGGTAVQTFNIPSRPWVEAAHRHGVKVIGTVFLAPTPWGGSLDAVNNLLVRDQDGSFPVAKKLIEIAQYYRFDGWLMNQETDLIKAIKKAGIDEGSAEGMASEIATEILAFTQYLHSIAPPEMEIHWYDSMIPSGKVAWQNELNDHNFTYLGNDKHPSSDGMFLNYWWNQAMARESSEYAISHDSSPYRVYFGADLWPTRNAQKAFKKTDWLHNLFTDNGSKGLTSIALFANNFDYIFAGDDKTSAYSNFKNDPDDVRSFYDTQTRLFAGDDLNLAEQDPNDAWVGIGHYVPSKSTIQSLPFITHFNTGHGKFKANQGKKVASAWHDMSQQDILPTWQFLVEGNSSVSVRYDFEHAYEGGSSLRIAGNLSQGSASIPLYQTDLGVKTHTSVSLAYKSPMNVDALSLWLRFDDNSQIKFPVSVNKKATNQWQQAVFKLSAFAGKKITALGLSVDKSKQHKFNVNIGKIHLQ